MSRLQDRPVTDTPLRILFAEPYDAAAVARMVEVGDVTILESCAAASLVGAVTDCDALLVRTGARVTREVIEAGGRLRVIGRGGVGIDNIDVEAAKEHGVQVVYTPAASTDAVADLAVGLMLAVVRQIVAADGLVRSGRFAEGRKSLIGPELGALTIGIVGLGRIGKAVAKRCQLGFGARVVYNDIVDPGRIDFEATERTKERLFGEADIVSLHVPLTGSTRGLIGPDTLATFKRGSILINTARGAVVDSSALAEALDTGTLAGAGLDVAQPEPLPAGHPLLGARNVVLTPHVGARSPTALARMNEVVEDVARVLAGEAPLFSAW